MYSVTKSVWIGVRVSDCMARINMWPTALAENWEGYNTCNTFIQKRALEKQFDGNDVNFKCGRFN